MNVRDPVQHRIGVNAFGAVQQGDDEWQDAVVAPHPPAYYEGAAVAEEARFDHIERHRGQISRGVVQQRIDAIHDALRVALQVPERDGKSRDSQEGGDQVCIDS